MKRFSQQFHTKAQSVKLQAVERAELKQRVFSYMEYHPLPHTNSTPSSKQTSRYRALIASPFANIKVPSLTFARASWAIAAVVFVAVPVLAERAVPGDNLYAIKVQFNEEVRGTLAFSPYEKIEWETERLNRRVAEARLLASEGRLTEVVESEIAAAVKEHTDSVRSGIDELRTEDADGAALASIELATTLAAQSAALQEEGSEVLAMAVEEVGDDQNSSQRVVDVINESLTEQLSQVEATSLPPFDKVMARLEQNTTRAFEILQSLGLQADDKLYVGLSRRLDDVGRSVATAQANRGDNQDQAHAELIDALERTQKLIVYMTDVQGNAEVDIEAVVPIILTAEEEAAKVAMLTEEVNRKTEILAALKPQLSVELAEKIDYSLSTTQDGTSAADTDSPLSKVEKQLALIDDALKMVASEGIDITAVPVEVPVTVASTSEATTTEAAVESTEN